MTDLKRKIRPKETAKKGNLFLNCSLRKLPSINSAILEGIPKGMKIRVLYSTHTPVSTELYLLFVTS